MAERTDSGATPGAITACPACSAAVAVPAARCSACGEWLTDPEKLIEARPGDVYGDRYRLDGLIGVGGMARVWRAFDVQGERDVALKLLGAELIGDHAAEQRFLLEGKTLREIQHPNVVNVFDSGLFPNGMPYIAMELLEGKLLSELMRQVGSLSAERVLKLMIQVAGGVGETHRRGWVHRDLKPDNIFVVPPSDDGRAERAVLLDFGIAIHPESREAVESRDGLGTTEYASPEQATGEPLGTRTDVYSLGVVMYQLLTGSLPGKRGATDTATVRRTGRVNPAGGATSPVLRKALEKIVIQALSPDAKQRHGDARHLQRDLERATAHLPAERAPAWAWRQTLKIWWWLPLVIWIVAGITAWLWYVAKSS